METAQSCSTAPKEATPEQDLSWLQATNAMQPYTRPKSKARPWPKAKLGGATRQYCPFWFWTRSQQGWGQTGDLGTGTWAEGAEIWQVHSAANEIL